MVLIGHGSYSFPEMLSPLLRFVGNASLGVGVFFVLSGFLIYNLSVRESKKTGGFDWKHFYVRRVLRIFPCFYLYIAVIVCLVCSGVLALSWPTILSASTFSLNYRHLWDHGAGSSDYFVIGHYWTLALEEQFYLTWPLLMFLFVKRRLFPVLMVFVALAPLIRLACYFFMPGSRGQLGMMFHTGFDSIAFGVLLGELLQWPDAKARLEGLAANRWVVGGTLGFLVFVAPILPEYVSRIFGERAGGAYSLGVAKSLQLLGLCLVIIASISFPRTVLFRVLNWPPLAYVGVLSYSLYVWNNLFFYTEKSWFVSSFPLNFICIMGMALVSHYLVERPFLKLKDRFHKTTVPLESVGIKSSAQP